MSRGKGNGDPQEKELPEGEPASPEELAEQQAAPESASGLAPVEPADELAALRSERDELKGALLRRRAEFDNYRKRVERERASASDEAAAGIFRQLADTVDNLERALGATGAAGAGESLRQGVELTLRDLRAMLETYGVAAIAPVGERFDPARHEALQYEAVPGFAEGLVAEVFRKGYAYKDRLLRPALVKVSSGDPGGDTDGGAEIQ